MAAVGSIIYGSDYNAVVTKLVQILGSGSPYTPDQGWGYNQALTAATVAPGAIITAAQWNTLVADVNKVYTHQYNTNSSVASAAAGDSISYARLEAINTALTTLMGNPSLVSPSQLTQSGLITNTYGATWGGGVSGIAANGWVSFGGGNAMQYFFNQGGKIYIQGTGPNTGTTQSNVWYNMLSGFNYTWNRSNINTIGGATVQVAYVQNEPSPYNLNWAQVQSSVDYTNGIIYFTWRMYDQHTGSGGGPDYVNPGAGFVLSQFYASGAFTGQTVASTSGAQGWYGI